MLLLDIGIFIVGLVILYFGAEALVDGASGIALRLGIVPLIVGCTVVAFGTSAPELVVSLAALFTAGGDAAAAGGATAGENLSVGNIIGSNIANLALILGIAALIRPIQVTSEVIWREYPVMLGSVVLFGVLAYDGRLSRIDGAILLACMAGYIGYMIVLARRSMAIGEEVVVDELEDIDPQSSTNLRDGIKVAVGVVGLAAGAQLMVMGATSIARDFDIPELVIGISVVAIGTSLPELATSTVAAFRGESDISVGNVIGSNVFNVFLVLGTVAAIASLGVGTDVLTYDLWVMLGVTILLWPVLLTGKRIGRVQGSIMLIGYVAYMVWLFMRPAA